MYGFPEPGEEHRSGGWVVKDLEFVPEAWSLKGEELADAAALMFGRRSYEAFAPVWPGSKDHADYMRGGHEVMHPGHANSPGRSSKLAVTNRPLKWSTAGGITSCRPASVERRGRGK